MRPHALLIAAVSIALLGVLGGAAAWAASSTATRNEPARITAVAAPFSAPRSMPRADDVHEGTYGYVTSSQLAARLDAAEQRAAPETERASGTAAGAGATIQITARVLPSVIVTLRDGAVERVEANTPERDLAAMMIVVRGGTLDPSSWDAVRHALGAAHAGTGIVWSR